MKKLMLIAIVGMFAVTTFAAPPSGGGRGPSGGGERGPAPSHRVEHRDPGPRKPQGGFEWTMFGLGLTRDLLFGPPAPRVIVREAPVVRERVIVTTPTTSVVTTPVVVEKPVVIEKTNKIIDINEYKVGDKTIYKITYEDGTTSIIEKK